MFANILEISSLASTWIKKRLGYDADRREVSRCCITGESEESIACTHQVSVNIPQFYHDPSMANLASVTVVAKDRELEKAN